MYTLILKALVTLHSLRISNQQCLPLLLIIFWRAFLSSLEPLTPCPNKEIHINLRTKLIYFWENSLEILGKPMLKDDEIP